MKKKLLHNKKGFTLIETLVAIGVLLLALTVPLSIAARGTLSAAYAQDQVVAFYLVQEATEYIRNIRDTNSIDGNSWLTGLSTCIGQACYIDITTETITLCSGTCPVLRTNASSNLYGYNGTWTPSIFTRTIQITPSLTNPQEAVLAISISWNTGVLSRSFSIREHLFDWQ